MIEIVFLYIFCGFFAGLLIGSVGIGGVILVPMLVYFGGADTHESIAAALFSFLVSGLVGTIIYMRRGIIDWTSLNSLVFGAIPGSLIGTITISYLKAELLIGLIAVLCIISGIKEIYPSIFAQNKYHSKIKNPLLFTFGIITGFASTLSGTGGPLVLVPLLVWRAVPLITSIGLAQVIQLPIAITATIGNSLNELMNWPIALSISVGIGIGSFAGATLAKLASLTLLKRTVSALLLASGGLMIWSLII